jgi:DNA-binding CsgD family transcriptional regulator
MPAPRPRHFRACHRLIDECRDLGADADAWHRHLVDQLCALVDAQVGIGGNTRHLAPGKKPQSLGTFRRGWSSDAEARSWETYARTVPMTRTPEYNRLVNAARPIVTLRRDQLWGRDAWYRSATYNEVHRKSGIDDYIISIVTRGDVSNSVWLHRPIGARPFTRLEWYLVHLVHRQIGAMMGDALATAMEPGVRRLSRRLRETLDALLDGDSEKEVAARFGLSGPTVHEYVGALYRHFGVASRAELMSLFVGRARPPLDPASDAAAGNGSARRPLR